MNIVLTGFEPFGQESMNPSWEAVRALPDQIGPATIIRYCLPVEYRAVRPKLLEILRTHQPYAMICIGQAGGRAVITPERIAINLMDARSADESGYLAEEEPIRPGGPDAYFSGLPIRSMVSRIQAQGIPAAPSLSAGTFVCNCTMYHLMDLIAHEGMHTKGGFVHLPYLPQQAAEKPSPVPSMALETMIQGLLCCVESVLPDNV